eukprot:1145895-Pelagomonas_calceolata.AAC.2
MREDLLSSEQEVFFLVKVTEVTEAEESLQSKCLTAGLFTKKEEFMQKGVQFVVALVDDCKHVKMLYMMNGRQIRSHVDRGVVEGSWALQKRKASMKELQMSS